MSRRRTRDENDMSDSVTPPSSQGSKRRRLNSEAPEGDDDDDVLPDSFRRTPRGNRRNRLGEEEHQPGSVVRIAVKNFVTYTKAEFKCGPSLNMIIGPNGTGKSTLVCAICLGLGYKPNVLGRAKDIGEFVKHGSKEAEIEVELAGKAGKSGNPIIQHTIKREGNKSSWRINDRQVTHKEVMKLVRSFSIQIDNLCQFLPQDRVVEFAQMTPVGLLESTQKAAAGEHMTVWHEELKGRGAEKIRLQSSHAESAKNLEQLEKRQAAQQREVDSQRERQGLMRRAKALEMARPGLGYAIEKRKYEHMRQSKQQFERELADLEAQVGPKLREVEEKQAHHGQISKVVEEARRVHKRFEDQSEEKGKVVERKREEVEGCDREYENEGNSHKSRKQEMARLDGIIRTLQQQHSQEPVQPNSREFNERVREVDQQLRDLRNTASDLREQQDRVKTRVDQKKQEREAAKAEMRELNSAAGQQNAKIQRLSQDTHRAWLWLQKHMDRFSQPIFGPPVITCSVKDTRYASAIETLLNRGDLCTFTCQNTNDWRILKNILQDELRLKDVFTRVITKPLDFFSSPISDDELKDFGLDMWAKDQLQGPDEVIAMLCDSSRLNRTGISLREQSESQYEQLRNSPIQQWIAGRNFYRVNRRREYNVDAVVVNQIRQAQYWTSSGIDNEMQRQLHERIREAESDLGALEEENEPLKEQITELQTTRIRLEKEKKTISEEKEALQKAYSIWQSLPTKIATNTEKLENIQAQQAETAARIEGILSRQRNLQLERAQAAIDYTISLENIQRATEELLEYELQLVEAASELEHLQKQSQRVRDMLEQRRRDIDQYKRDIDAQKKKCIVLQRDLAENQRQMQEMEDGDEMKDIMNAWLSGEDRDEDDENQGMDRTMAELDADIEDAQRRIGLLHEGNPRAMEQFAERGRQIEKVKRSIENFNANLQSLTNSIQEIRAQWEPQLEELVSQISAAFSHNFERIGCAGQVSVDKTSEDFRDWAIKIEVKFREHEELAVLDSHRQSGGERAVSTIFYLMALQSMARSPFRVVDEINQGMDPRNERMVHERMVEIACSENTSQYFLVTPKLLPNLKYDRRMMVHIIFSGEQMPSTEGATGGRLDFKKLANKAKGMARVY